MTHLSSDYAYLHTARATDLTGSDYYLYRTLEIMPAFLSYGTLVLFVYLSFRKPVWAAYLTIMFAGYWFFKTAYLSIHLRHNFKRMRHNMQLNWRDKVRALPHSDPEHHYVHMVMLPFFDEPEEVIDESVGSYANDDWDPTSIILVLAIEERAGDAAERVARAIEEKYRGTFMHIHVSRHPMDVPGDIPGKGSNLSYAAESARSLLDARGIPYERVIVSAFDADTVVYPQYFACLTYHVLTDPHPERASFQPVPLYNNNIWTAPMLSRVMAYSSSFWQMIQQERPEKLATFSSHAVLFSTLRDTGYWQRNVVSEDSRIFWNLFVRFDGQYRVVPLAYPVSMDANVAPSLAQTVRNIYKQHRRWTYGVENVPYLIYCSLKNKRMPWRVKGKAIVVQIEGFWSLATHPLVLFAIGWLPLIVGGSAFHTTVLSYNLPLIAKSFLTAAMFGLVVSAAICMHLMPPPPVPASRTRRALMLVQWILVPATMVAFSSIPGLESQTRLALGRYLGFWVTPKSRTAQAHV